MTQPSIATVAASETPLPGTDAKKTRGPKVNLLNIQRGRLPLALVFAIRFNEPADKSNNDLSKKYGTSVGKVFDIRKGRNFSYITADYKLTPADKAAAEEWAKGAAKHGGDEAAIMAQVDKIKMATEAEAASQAAAITAQRSKGPKGPSTPKASKDGAAPSANAKSLLS
jgi:hypothetical protein